MTFSSNTSTAFRFCGQQRLGWLSVTRKSLILYQVRIYQDWEIEEFPCASDCTVHDVTYLTLPGPASSSKEFLYQELTNISIIQEDEICRRNRILMFKDLETGLGLS